MLTKESDLLYLFAVMPWKAYTEAELKRAYGTKSKSYVERFLDRHISEGILVTEPVGNTKTYSLDMSSPKARAYAGAVLELKGWSKRHLPGSEMLALMRKMPYASYITLVTGSYARGTQKRDSDIDVVMIIEDCCEPKRVYAELRLASELSIPPVHLYVFKNSEFIEMLRNSEANYGKEIAQNFLALSQGQTYLGLIWEAMKNGFNGKHVH